MKSLRLVFLVAFAASSAQAPAQGSTGSAETLRYIHAAWDTLTRSMTDCHSLVDIKVDAHPVLYLPADIAIPPEVTAVEQKCNVKVAKLPRHIEKLGDVMPQELSAPGLLYLPTFTTTPTTYGTSCSAGT